MIHKSKHKKTSFNFLKDNDSIFHPLSYYLLGGTDLSNTQLDNSASVEFDNDEHISEMESTGVCSVPLGDPRCSFLDLVEIAGAQGAQDMVDGSNSDLQVSTPVE